MRLALFLCAAVLAAGANLRATQDAKKKNADKPLITVIGCVDGGWLRVRSQDPVGSSTERFKLRGAKQLLKEIGAQHNGHEIEVTGLVTDSASTTHRGKTIQVGKKTKIYTGAKEVPAIPVGDDPSLEVASYRELNQTCRSN